MNIQLTKWDGDIKPVWKWQWRWPFLYRREPDPIGHPQCIEVIVIQEGQLPRVIYQRAK